jgi:hypothetical protein
MGHEYAGSKGAREEKKKGERPHALRETNLDRGPLFNAKGNAG